MHKESSQVTKPLLDNKEEHTETFSQVIKDPTNFEEWAHMNEVPLPHTRWNWVKVMVINSYEMILITLCLALSVYKEDFFTLIYQFMMQGLLYFSIQDMGAKVGV